LTESELAAAKRSHPSARRWARGAGPHPLAVQSVLAVVAAYEDAGAECSSWVIDGESGLDSPVVDDVLDYLWSQDMIECRVSASPSRHPAVTDVRRVTTEEDRAWGPWGRYRPAGEAPGLLGA
jgi:hypothetical protein